MRCKFLLIFLLISGVSFGQVDASKAETGDVIFSAFPPIGKTIIRVDGTDLIERHDQRKVKLTEGEHRVEFWSYEYEYKDTIINVVADSSIVLKTVLVRNPEHVEYIDELRATQTKELRRKFRYRIPYSISIGTFVGGAVTFIPTLQFNSKVDNITEAYDASGDYDEIVLLKEDLENLKIETINKRNISYGLFGISLVTSVYGFIARRKYDKRRNLNPDSKPIYENKSPFKFGLEGGSDNYNLVLKYSF